MAEFETEATVSGEVKCPHCGQVFVTEITGTAVVEVEPDDIVQDLD